jgi:phage tail protein X
MSDEIETVALAGEGMMLDAILWQRFRKPTPGLLEKALDINPGLAALGPMLPHGTIINIPVQRQVAQAPTLAPVSLWD